MATKIHGAGTIDGDPSCEAGARRLASIIQAYWRRQGYTVKTRIERAANDSHYDVYAVKTDMANGLPTRGLEGVTYERKKAHNPDEELAMLCATQLLLSVSQIASELRTSSEKLFFD